MEARMSELVKKILKDKSKNQDIRDKLVSSDLSSNIEIEYDNKKYILTSVFPTDILLNRK